MEEDATPNQPLDYETPPPQPPAFAIHWGGWVVVVVLVGLMTIAVLRRF